MRRMGLFGLVAGTAILKVLAVVVFGGFLVLLVLNAIGVLGLEASAFLVLVFFALVGVYTFYQHYFGTP